MCAHQIETAAFGNNTPAWHKLGTVVAGAMTAAEALHLGGLDWQVRKSPLLVSEFYGGNFLNIEVPETYATVPSTDNKVLGVVKGRYDITQNEDAFKFFDSIVDRGEAIYDACGSLDGGRRIWVLAQIPGDVVFKTLKLRDDITKKYVLLTTSHDGSTPTIIKPTSTRVVCANTLGMALRGKEMAWKIRHTVGAEEALKEAAEKMGLVSQAYGIYEEAMRAFGEKEMTAKQIHDYTASVLKSIKSEEVDDDGSEEGEKKEPRALAKILALNETQPGAEMTRGTLWGALNAVTRYVDFEADYRGTPEERENNHLRSTMFNGVGVNMKLKALSRAMELV